MFFRNIDKDIQNIVNKYGYLKETIERLEKENQELRDEHYKDAELSRMSEQLNYMRKANMNGFPITEEENEKIKQWQDQHLIKVHGLDTLEKRVETEGAIGGRWTYKFIPTSIGTIGTVRCGACGEEFTFQEMD